MSVVEVEVVLDYIGSWDSICAGAALYPEVIEGWGRKLPSRVILLELPQRAEVLD